MFEPPDTITDLASAIDRRFFAPLRRPRTRRVGVELELPVWNLTPGKATDFDAVHARFLDYYPVLQEAFNRRGHALTGMGINPRWRENRPEPIGNGYGAAELRGIMARRAWPTFIDRPALVMQLHRILDLSAKGLARRGFGEEPLLDPLRRRADMLTNPALEQLDRLAHGESIENIARDYGALSSGKKVRHA